MSNFKKKQAAIADTDVRSIDEAIVSMGGLFRKSKEISVSGSGASELDGLSDVSITTPELGDVLKFTGSSFINQQLATPAHTVYVSLAGSDLGTGSFDRPFRTIQAAYNSIQDAAFDNKYIIQLGIGTFEEDYLNIKGNVALLGAAPGAMGANDENITRITVTGIGGNKIELDLSTSGVSAPSLFIFKDLVFTTDLFLDFTSITGTDLIGIDFFHCSHNGIVTALGSSSIYSFIEGYFTNFGTFNVSNMNTYFPECDMLDFNFIMDGVNPNSFTCLSTTINNSLTLSNPGPSPLDCLFTHCHFFDGTFTTSGTNINLTLNATSFPKQINNLVLTSGTTLTKTTSAYSILPGAGTTAARPSGIAIDIGFSYFDTDLSVPVWWDGSTWVNSQGNPQ